MQIFLDKNRTTPKFNTLKYRLTPKFNVLKHRLTPKFIGRTEKILISQK